jgi:hypothetical protein
MKNSRHANHLVRRCEFRSVSDTSNFVSLLVNFKSYRKRDTIRGEIVTAFVLQSITPVGEEKIKERCRAINEDDIIGLVKLIITCHSSTGKASLL